MILLIIIIYHGDTENTEFEKPSTDFTEYSDFKIIKEDLWHLRYLWISSYVLLCALCGSVVLLKHF
jgi:hypothetical protein